MKNGKVKKIAFLGLMATLALVLSYAESLLPPIYPAIPGIKMGLPNIVIICTLYKFGIKEAISVSFIRLICVVLLFGNGMTLIYSISGAILSLALMWIFKKLDLFSMVGVSIIGGVSHNIGQILAAILILETTKIGYYMIVLAVTGTISGALVGLAGNIFTKRLNKIKL